ncbi:Uncharacterized protein APZ42_012609 [Daphnia magna]|uniref:Secreted protein n=1 Tax=Daphnia magna TaxID=35525 RepID=A0A0P6HZS1_9CRUS|nr:Uncharacterized protein APZ42_012609 [Daphnia magna]
MPLVCDNTINIFCLFVLALLHFHPSSIFAYPFPLQANVLYLNGALDQEATTPPCLSPFRFVSIQPNFLKQHV